MDKRPVSALNFYLYRKSPLPQARLTANIDNKDETTGTECKGCILCRNVILLENGKQQL